MEVEAKFSVPSRDTMDRLKRIVRLGPFEPGDAVQHSVADTYYDTVSRDLYAHGYAYRVRQVDDQYLATIKGLGNTNSAIHSRIEVEVPVSSGGGVPGVDTWPPGEVWDQARAIVGDEPLRALFSVVQDRHVRDLYCRGLAVAQLSIDEVLIEAQGRRQRAWIAEAELGPDGTVHDLEKLASHLEKTWGLVPDSSSKFRMGLALADEQEYRQEMGLERLSSAERAQLEHIVEATTDERIRKRAQLLLGWAQHKSVRRVASEIGGSKSWAYGWIERFCRQRMAIFPEHLTQVLLVADLPSADQERPSQAVVPSDLPAPDGETVDALMARFEVDAVHARCVRDHAMRLFDETVQIHGLEPDDRRLLEYASLLHATGLGVGPSRHHLTGRDLLLANRLTGVSAMEQRMLAAAVGLHRKRIKRQRLETETIQSLPVTARETMLRIAALLRMAEGLDGTQRQSSQLARIEIASERISASVVGPLAQRDAASAQARADLWNRLFDVPFVFVGLASQSRPIRRDSPRPANAEAKDWQSTETPKRPGIVADDLMTEAGRKTLRFHFFRMLAHEQGTREGEDVEELHDMRVATRRMRSAFRVFASFYRGRAIRPLIQGLRRTARTLGAVRDLDVLIGKARSYLQSLPPERSNDLDPLLAVWHSERGQARARMLAYLDGAKYAEFKDTFWRFLETTTADAQERAGLPPQPRHVQHVVPALVYSRWANVQAFGPLAMDAALPALHALRIECKRLRYGLEFFEEVLGPEAKTAISEVVLLQDHLGDLNDADIANAMLSEFLFGTVGTARASIIAPGVVSYLAHKQRELTSLIEDFPSVWTRFNRAETKHLLASALAVL